MDVRDKVQQEAKEAFLSSDRKRTIIASVGAGKSKIALDIIKELNPQRILLLTNAITLRDVNWKDEFVKFGMGNYWDRVVSKTYQGSYDNEELKTTEWDLIIADEIDFACTIVYSLCFDIPAKVVLGLTGFITKDKREILEEYFPVCYEIGTEEMQEGSLLNKSEFIFIEFPLSKERTIEKKLKKGGTFKQSENGEYEYWDKAFQKAMIVKSTIEKKYRLLGIPFAGTPEWTKADWNFKFAATKRKALLHNLTSSAKVVGQLLNRIINTPGNKVLIFSANTKQCDKFPNTFHNKKVEATLDDLNTGRVKIMSVVKKITRGVNLIGVNYLIRESYDGSEEIFNQSHGRLLRLRPDQVAKYIILVPMYEALVRQPGGVFRKTILPTQASSWIQKMTNSFSMKHPRVIRLDNDYVFKDGIQI